MPRPPESSFRGVIARPALVLVAAVVSVVAGPSGCSVNPATGEPQFTAFLSVADEVEYGREESAREVRRAGGRLDDAKAAAMLERVAARLSAVTVKDRPDVAWTVTLVDDPAYNAFALPGGFIHFNRGALALMNDEAEMAAIMAHEMAHVTARHGAAGTSVGVLVDLAAAAWVVLAGADADTTRTALGVTRLVEAGYTREQEAEADRVGLRYLYEAGYDPFAMARISASAMRWRDYQAVVEGPAAPFSLYDTHPPDEWRRERAMVAAAELPPGGETGRDAHLDAIDGLAWGDVAARGLVQGRHVVHERLGFQFTVPVGYRTVLAPDRIIAEKPVTGTVMVFDVATNHHEGDVVAHLREAWGEVLSLEDVASHRFAERAPPAAKARGRLRVAGREWRAWAVAVGLSHDRAYRFLCLGPLDGEGLGERDCLEAAGSLGALDHARAVRRVVTSLRVETVGRGDTVDDFAARMAFMPEPAALFRVLNGLDESEALTEGRRVKIVVVE